MDLRYRYKAFLISLPDLLVLEQFLQKLLKYSILTDVLFLVKNKIILIYRIWEKLDLAQGREGDR